MITEKIKTIVEDAVVAAIKPLSDEVVRLKKKLIDLRTKLRELDTITVDRADDLKQYQSRNNLRIFEIKETAEEYTNELVQQPCH